jgi:hypothetical protein
MDRRASLYARFRAPPGRPGAWASISGQHLGSGHSADVSAGGAVESGRSHSGWSTPIVDLHSESNQLKSGHSRGRRRDAGCRSGATSPDLVTARPSVADTSRRECGRLPVPITWAARQRTVPDAGLRAASRGAIPSALQAASSRTFCRGPRCRHHLQSPSPNNRRGITTQTAGSGKSHNIVQPTLVLNYIKV